jgi:hypothetical protein
VHLLRSESALELLPAEEIRLDFVPPLGRIFSVGLGALAVTAAEARGDEVSKTAGLEKRLDLDALR